MSRAFATLFLARSPAQAAEGGPSPTFQAVLSGKSNHFEGGGGSEMPRKFQAFLV